MIQRGDSQVFHLSPAPSADLVYSYVWSWWDGTRDATQAPWIRKTVNMGGRPGTDELVYSCTAVLNDGRHDTVSDVILANNPPVILAPVVVSANDTYFPYTTEIQVRAFDFDGDALTFAWYDGDTLLGNGTTESDGTTTGTWTGNGTTVTDTYNVVRNTFEITVDGSRSLELRVTDARSGVSRFPLELRGRQRPAPVMATGSSQSLERLSPLVRVGAGAEAVFEVYGRDPAGGSVAFAWTFAGSLGWTQPSGGTGTVTVTPDGGAKSTYTKDLSGELFPDGPEKTVTALATVTVDGGSSEVRIPVALQANRAPSGITVTFRVNGQVYNPLMGLPILAGDRVELAAVGADADNDLLHYTWTLAQPAGFVPSTLKLFGAKILVDTTGWSGHVLQPLITATDRYGATRTETVTALPIQAPS